MNLIALLKKSSTNVSSKPAILKIKMELNILNLNPSIKNESKIMLKTNAPSNPPKKVNRNKLTINLFINSLTIKVRGKNEIGYKEMTKTVSMSK